MTQDKIGYLRVITTDKCNMNCAGCHKEGQYSKKNISPISIIDAITACIRVGVKKVKLMGGEPTLYYGLLPLIHSIKTQYPSVDLSMISNGTAEISYYKELFESGLDRLNISVHGWGKETFTINTYTSDSLWHKFHTNTIQLLELGLITKLNYVIKKHNNESDLFSLLSDISPYRGVRVDILNFITAPNNCFGNEWQYSMLEIESLLSEQFGISQICERMNPYSLPSKELVLKNEVHVNLKSEQLKNVNFLNCCNRCPVKDYCIEGITAVRLNTNMQIQPCLFRTDNCFSIDNDILQNLESLYNYFISL